MAPGSVDCIICSEALEAEGASLTRCGHVFHTHCLSRWFEHQPVCPLCKTKKGREEFIRALRSPAPLALEDEARMRKHADADVPVATVEARLAAALQQAAHQHDQLAQLRESTAKEGAPKRARLQRLKAELVHVRRECHKARVAEATAQDAAASSSSTLPVCRKDTYASTLTHSHELPLAATTSSVAREAVINQSKQLQWRCEELRALDDKIDGLREELRTLQNVSV